MPLFRATEDLLLPERYVRKGEVFRADTAPVGCINFDLNAHPYSVYAKKFSLLKAGTTRALHGKTREIFGAPEPGWFEE